MPELVLTDQNFSAEVLKSTLPVLVDFYAVWCGPCQMQAPIIEELAEKYKEKIKIGVLDVDQAQNTAMQYQVSSIPTLIIFKGGQEVERLMGLQQMPTLKEKLNNLL